MISRKLTSFAGALALLACAPVCFAAQLTPDQALAELKAGNARYMGGKSAHPRIDVDRRRATADNGQEPIAAILGCADSRVPPEIVFDQPFANLFVVRVAGNVCGIPELASIEYGVAALHTPLIVVLGHTKCGAVQAAVDKKPLPGSLPELMSMIRPSVDAAEKDKNAGDDLVTRATKQNVLHSMSVLMDLSPIVKNAVKDGKVKLVGAIREIRDGHIEFIDQAH